MLKKACASNLVMVLIVSLLAAAPASARSDVILRAEIPFDFYVGDRALPAGEYTVSSASDDESLLRIRGANGGQSMFVVTNGTHAKRSQSKRARLTFHKYGDQLYLAVVWNGGQEGRTLIESKRERNLRKEMRASRSAETDVAEVQLVTVYARCEEN